jgi:hypothetical protein
MIPAPQAAPETNATVIENEPETFSLLDQALAVTVERLAASLPAPAAAPPVQSAEPPADTRPPVVTNGDTSWTALLAPTPKRAAQPTPPTPAMGDWIDSLPDLRPKAAEPKKQLPKAKSRKQKTAAKPAVQTPPAPPIQSAEPPATDKQKNWIKTLRDMAKGIGGEAARFAATKCDDTKRAASVYIDTLRAKMNMNPPAAAPPAVAPPPAVSIPMAGVQVRARAGMLATDKQWKYVAHLRGRMTAINTAETRALANYRVPNDRRQVSLYIDRMRAAAKQTFMATRPQIGQMVCSACWVLGCSIGPMVPYTGKN